ncbi:MAG TPA: VanZ family protein [Hydrogenophaga sp.]|uniref:VanZ family protein n=1 Tax=Hydrogenophaga sp. TaxID=1904254 RepID=UPI002C32BF95|nr:VanZ family protein [Hydrogenophaga sp.]HMN94635.1 VanZ family protein [Hydrogenophaga sp.]HMP11638.1 VanZ family protein [Hydrogenophaga sp.]
MKHTSSAWTLALLFAALVLYASLYPFAGWRLQAGLSWHWLLAPWPRYWTAFDVWANFLGYVPLGFLLAVAMVRTGWGPWSWPMAVLLPAVFSLSIETLQTLLPTRVPSNLDLVLNSAGGLVGATLAWALERMGFVRRWARWRADWFEADAHGGLVLLALWFPALLYPAPIPFGLGQVWERLEAVLQTWFEGTPFVQWVPAASAPLIPLSPLAESLGVMLCLLAPLMLGYSQIRTVSRRLWLVPLLLLLASLVEGFSYALTYGPQQAWTWINPAVLLGSGLALLVGLALLALPRRLCLVLMLMSLAVSLTLLNRVPETPYFAQSLEIWEQGRFIRFHGLSQWLGWLWPWAALLFGLLTLGRSRH